MAVDKDGFLYVGTYIAGPDNAPGKIIKIAY